MAHYPIKCVRCSHISTNDEVLFDLENAVTGMTSVLAQNRTKNGAPTIAPKSQKTTSKRRKSIWDDDEDEEETSKDSDARVDSLEDLMTYPQIQKYCEAKGIDTCIPQWQQVDVTPDFADALGVESENDLLVGVHYKRDKDGQVIRATRRYCPICKSELPSQSGAMPTYNITVMGTTSSGKTVYLCALYWLLSNSQGMLPYQSQLSSVFSRGNHDFITSTNALFNQGLLPGTTQIVLTEPLVVQMTYSLQNYTKKCLLALADMRGEDFADQDGGNLLQRGEYFSHADGFMVLISPLNIPKLQAMLPSGGIDNRDTTVHQALMSNISDYILPFFNNGEISVPSVVLMSKSDIIMRYRDALGIHPANPVVANEPKDKFTHTYFANQDKGTRQIISQEIPLYNFLTNTFRGSFFTSFSSLGQASSFVKQDDNGRIVEHPATIHPIRVIDPIIYLLISLGFLPEFYRMESNPAAAKKNEEILKHWVNTKTNQKI